MGGHNDQNGNSNGQHDDVSMHINLWKVFIGAPLACVYVLVDTRALLTAILKFFMCVSGVEVRLKLVKKWKSIWNLKFFALGFHHRARAYA